MHGAVRGGQWGYFEGTGGGDIHCIRNLASKQSEVIHPLMGVETAASPGEGSDQRRNDYRFQPRVATDIVPELWLFTGPTSIIKTEIPAT